jgi:NAD(P)-dependent dehydrogenase (short-subunit alcohol dehydrogenase family)
VTGDLDKIRLELDTSFYSKLAKVRAYAPVLAAGGGGAVLNVMSAMSWLSFVGANAYGVAKAAEWSLTNGVRLELAAQGTLVSGLYLAAADTDMMEGQDVPKSDPADVVSLALDGIEVGLLEIIADEQTAAIKCALSADPAVTYAGQLATASGQVRH